MSFNPAASAAPLTKADIEAAMNHIFGQIQPIGHHFGGLAGLFAQAAQASIDLDKQDMACADSNMELDELFEYGVSRCPLDGVV